MLFFVILITPASAGHRIDATFLDGNQDPITTALDLRISLWDIYEVRNGDIDGNGDINTSATHYGGYQTTTTITPDEEGRFIPRYKYGFYKLYTKNLTDFPAITLSNYYLQLEYKAQGAPNTSYQIYDFVNDPPYNNISRHKILDAVAYTTSDAGPQTIYNTFTLDGNNNAASEIKLQFGEILAKSLSYSVTNNWFVLDDRLNVTGDAGEPKLTIVANDSDPADQAQFTIRDSSGTVFGIDQDGEIDVDRNGTARNLVASTNSATDGYRPLLDAGVDSDGTVTFNTTFATTPYIFLTIYNTSTANIVPSLWVTSKSTTGFTYKVTMYNGSTISDLTSSTDVHWLAAGVE